MCRDGAQKAMLRRNIKHRLHGLVVFVFVVVVVVIIPIVVTVIVGRIADGCRVVIVIVARARAMRSTAVRGHHALGARSNNDRKIAHAGGMRRF
ncbi:MAG TPA: hypothetical protein VJX31_00055 [Casimicrobiaceae bacterium]|nr:hypothetical protein [Casimicrobiaceae bacterium]